MQRIRDVTVSKAGAQLEKIELMLLLLFVFSACRKFFGIFRLHKIFGFF